MGRRRTTITLPDGPALLFVGPWRPDGTRTVTPVDREAVADRRERWFYNACAGSAKELAAAADARDDPNTERPDDELPFGFSATADTERSGDHPCSPSPSPSA